MSPLLTDDQVPLASAMQAVHRSNGDRLLALIQRTINVNAISLSDVARETGIDNSHITRMLSGEAGLRRDFLAAVLAKDQLGVFVLGLAAMVGYEAHPKTPDLAEENRRLREQVARLKAVLAEEP